MSSKPDQLYSQGYHDPLSTVMAVVSVSEPSNVCATHMNHMSEMNTKYTYPTAEWKGRFTGLHKGYFSQAITRVVHSIFCKYAVLFMYQFLCAGSSSSKYSMSNLSTCQSVHLSVHQTSESNISYHSFHSNLMKYSEKSPCGTISSLFWPLLRQLSAGMICLRWWLTVYHILWRWPCGLQVWLFTCLSRLCMYPSGATSLGWGYQVSCQLSDMFHYRICWRKVI